MMTFHQKEQWKLYWHWKILPCIYHTIPMVSPPATIAFHPHLMKNVH
jgi:hypothetical protein